MTGRFPFHPVLFIAAFVVHNVAATESHPMAAGRALLVAIILAAVLQILASAVARSRHRGAVIATAGLLVGILWVPIVVIAGGIMRLSAWQLLVLLVLSGLAAALGARVVVSAWRQIRAQRLTELLNGFTVILSAVVLVTFAASPAGAQLPSDIMPPSARSGAPSTSSPPDILLIIPDGHPRADALAEQTGADMDEFLEALQARGFEVAAGAHANYDYTSAALGSMFHLGLLDDPPMGTLVNRTTINRNPAFELMRAAGYRIVAIGPPHEHVTLRESDVFLGAGYLNSFECHLMRRTAVSSLVWAASPAILPDIQRAGVLRSIDLFEEVVASGDGPQFVILHLPVPHVPVMWDGNGNPVNDPFGMDCAPQDARGMPVDELRAAYIDQLGYLHHLLLDTIDRAVQAATRPPVILVMSDHGAKIGDGARERDSPAGWRDTFGILFASSTPGSDRHFDDSISLVNVLPILFNTYLGTEIPLERDATDKGVDGRLVEVSPPTP